MKILLGIVSGFVVFGAVLAFETAMQKIVIGFLCSVVLAHISTMIVVYGEGDE